MKSSLAFASGLCLVLLMTFPGCSNDTSSEEVARQTSLLNDESECSEDVRSPDGRVRAVVNLTPSEPTLSDVLTMTLTVTAPAEFQVTLPEFQSAFPELVVRDFREPLPSFVDQNQVLIQIYELEPTAAGELNIPPFTIRHKEPGVAPTATADSLAGTGETLRTNPLTFTVQTVIDINSLSLDQLKPAAPPILPPKPEDPFPWLQWVVGCISVATVVAVWLVRRNRCLTVVPRPPSDVAAEELELLLADQDARNDLPEFYVRLTGIVRRYIEAETGVNAAEQTTEEFLREIQNRQLFTGAADQQLQDFLQSADLIKFAGQTPDSAAIDDSVKMARRFIQLPIAAKSEAAEQTGVAFED